MRYRVCILGGGSWGTALAHHLGRKGLKVSLWFRDPERASIVRERRENIFYHPGIKIHENVFITSDLGVVSDSESIIVAIPTQFLRNTLEKIKDFLRTDQRILSASKGIERKTLLLPSKIFEDVLDKKVASLTGPSFSKEVMEGKFTSVVVSCEDEDTSLFFQDLLHTESFRVYINRDQVGCEVAAAMKNVIAIASGILDGLSLGLNARAALITRGIAEITRLGVAMGANPVTFQGLSGIGDLLLTSTGDLSRNRRLGLLLGKGYSLDDAKKMVNGIPEGVDTAVSSRELSKNLGVRMPISREVYNILFEGKSVEESMKDLIKEKPYHEWDI